MFWMLKECIQIQSNSKTQSFRIKHAVNSKLLEEIVEVCAYVYVLCIPLRLSSVSCMRLVFLTDETACKQTKFTLLSNCSLVNELHWNNLVFSKQV